MRQVFNDLLSAEEKNALQVSLEEAIADTHTKQTVTYWQGALKSRNDKTGAISYGAEISEDVDAWVSDVTRSEDPDENIPDGTTHRILIAKSVLDGHSIAPTTRDTITVFGDVKHILSVLAPAPYIHYRFFVGDKGND